MKQRLINNSGFTLLSVILVITVISVLGTSVVGVTLNSVKTSSIERDDQAVFYIAEAGLTVEVEKMKLKAKEIYENEGLLNISSCDNDLECIENLRVIAAEDFFTELQSVEEQIIENNDFETVTNGKIKPKAEVKVKQLSDIESPYSREYMITSEGFIDDKSRTVEQIVALTWPGVDQNITLTPDDSDGSIDELPEGTAAYVKEGITHDGGTVVGNLGSLKCNSTEKVVKITNGGSKVVGDIYLPEHCEDKSIEVENWMIDNGYFSKYAKPSQVNNIPVLPIFPEEPHTVVFNGSIKGGKGKEFKITNGKLSFEDRSTDYVLNITENSWFDYIKFGHGNTLNIDTNNEDRTIIVNKLKVGGVINNTGKNNLNIIIKDEMNIGGSGILGVKGKENLVNILYAGTKDLNFNGNQRIYNSIYSKIANITIGGSAELTGNIFSHGEEINILGHGDSNSQVILAPNAHVRIEGSGKVVGSIYANSLYLSGGGERIVYKEGWITDGPISVPKPDPDEPEVSEESLDIDEYINKNPVSEV